MLSSPTFTLDATIDNKVITRKSYRTLKSVANNIIKGNNSVPSDIKEELKNSSNDRYLLRDKLNIVYDKYIKKDINKIALATSIKVACSTGMSKNNTFDACTIIISNVRMIMQIVIKCGFQDYSSFSKTFKKLIGKTPMEYRNSQKQIK